MLQRVGSNRDRALQRHVEAELIWDRQVDERGITVVVQDGIVSLSGLVHDKRDRQAAVAAALKVHGVIGVEDDLSITRLMPATTHAA